MIKKKMNKTLLVFVALLLVLTFSVNAGGEKEEAKPAEGIGGPLEVGVLWEEGPWFDIVKGIGDSLESEYPGTKMKYTFNNTAAKAALELRWQNGDPLDVPSGRWKSQVPSTWVNADEGLLVDLTPYVNETLPGGEKWMDTFAPVARGFCVDTRPDSETNGKWFGVPETLVLMVIQYNKKAFREMGVEPVETWPEFLDLCETIKKKGAGIGMKPICLSGPTAPYCAHWWDRMTQRMVGRAEVDKVLFGKTAHLRDNPDFLAAAKELEKLVKNDYFMDGYQGADFTGAQAMFFQGKAAMIHMGTWLLGEMADVVPDDFEAGVMAFPMVPGGKGDQHALFGSVFTWSIANPDKCTSHEINVLLAVEYLKRFTGKEASTKRAAELGNISALKGVPSPPKLMGIDSIIKKAENSGFINYYYGITAGGPKDVWWNASQALLLGKIDAETMIKQIDEGLDNFRAIQ